MRSKQDFDGFYSGTLAPLISGLKEQRSTATAWGITALASAVLTVVCFIADHNDYLPGGTSIAIFFILLLIVAIYMYTRKKDDYTERFKETVIKEIMNYLHPGLVYKPMEFIPSKEYRSSGLYRRRYDNIDGDDLVEGVYKNVSFRCSELETQYYGGAVNGRYITIFKGLFFSAKVNSGFTGGTYIWTRGYSQLGDSIADERYRMYRMPPVHLVRTANEEFNKHFIVYSSYPSQAYELLTPAMLNNIVKFRTQLNRELTLSVVAGRCYVAIPINEDLLEPDGNLEDKETIKEYFFTILLILSIINQLELYTLSG